MANLSSATQPWHLDKRVPLALIVTIVLQTGGIVWWVATTDERVKALEADVQEHSLKIEANARAVADQKIQLVRLEEKLNSVLAVLGRIERSLEAMNR